MRREGGREGGSAKNSSLLTWGCHTCFDMLCLIQMVHLNPGPCSQQLQYMGFHTTAQEDIHINHCSQLLSGASSQAEIRLHVCWWGALLHGRLKNL